MPLVLLEDISPNTTFGIWKITEDETMLLSLRPLPPEEKEHILNLKNNRKRKQRLAYRVLLQQILKRDYCLTYAADGKPMLHKENLYLSVSHSGDYAAAIVSATQKVGIDIEEVSQRMPLLASRFLTAKEMKEIDLQNSKLLHVYWGAKECLYKIYADTHILFSEHLSLLPFDIEKDSQTTAYIDFNKLHAQHKIIFQSVDNYMLVIVC